MKILLFGGAFDPPHKGHRALLSRAASRDDFDKIIIMPTGTPGHKAACKTPFRVRKLMAEKAFLPLFPNAEVSDVEGASLEKSYSYITAEKLLAQYPGARIYFAIGSDSALTLPTWKNWQRLAENVTFLILSRDGEDSPLRAQAPSRGQPLPRLQAETTPSREMPQKTENFPNGVKPPQSKQAQQGAQASFRVQASLRAQAARDALMSSDLTDPSKPTLARAVEKIKIYSPGTRVLARPEVPMSSTRIRRISRQGADISGYVCRDVANIIKNYNLYSPDFYEKNHSTLRLLLKLMLREKRAIHTLNVEALALELAQIHGRDEKKARVASLLHDIMKQQPPRLIRRRAEREIGQKARGKETAVLHGRAAADYGRYELGIEDPDILAAVTNHTLARPGMSKLEEIIYLADMLCRERSFEGKDRLLSIARQNLDKAMEACLQNSIEYVKSRGEKLDLDSVRALEYYRGVNGGKTTDV